MDLIPKVMPLLDTADSGMGRFIIFWRIMGVTTGLLVNVWRPLSNDYFVSFITDHPPGPIWSPFTTCRTRDVLLPWEPPQVPCMGTIIWTFVEKQGILLHLFGSPEALRLIDIKGIHEKFEVRSNIANYHLNRPQEVLFGLNYCQFMWTVDQKWILISSK